eukprot:3347145-Rhodomonas_salina.1
MIREGWSRAWSLSRSMVRSVTWARESRAARCEIKCDSRLFQYSQDRNGLAGERERGKGFWREGGRDGRMDGWMDGGRGGDLSVLSLLLLLPPRPILRIKRPGRTIRLLSTTTQQDTAFQYCNPSGYGISVPGLIVDPTAYGIAVPDGEDEEERHIRELWKGETFRETYMADLDTRETRTHVRQPHARERALRGHIRGQSTWPSRRKLGHSADRCKGDR